MFLANRGVLAIGCRACQMLRFCSTSSNYEGLALNPKFTSEEQQKILDVLNYSTTDKLSRFDVSQGRIKSLDSWRSKKGPFKSLLDVLEVDGLGVKVLERLCASILTDNGKELGATNVKVNSKTRRQFLSPQLNSEQTTVLSSAVGLHLGPAGMSWAKINRAKNQVTSWGFHDFSAFPKKMLPTDTFQLATTVLGRLPMGEVYIFEASPNMGPQAPGAKQATMMTSYNQQLELTSMLLALINTSPKHNSFQPEDVTSSTNSVYYLRANLAARLFRTWMGSERVSATSTIFTLLENSKKADSNFTLPCTPILIEEELHQEYYGQNPVFRELLGQALLLIITFMDLCVYKTPTSLAAVVPGRRQN